MSINTKTKFSIGDYVHKTKGDYYFKGVVVAVFEKKSGRVRYVVENPDGILHIYKGANLEIKLIEHG